MGPLSELTRTEAEAVDLAAVVPQWRRAELLRGQRRVDVALRGPQRTGQLQRRIRTADRSGVGQRVHPDDLGLAGEPARLGLFASHRVQEVLGAVVGGLVGRVRYLRRGEGESRHRRIPLRQCRVLELDDVDLGSTGGQRRLVERVDLGAIEVIAEDAGCVGERVLVRAHVEPVLVGADVRIVTEARATAVRRGVLRAVVLYRQAVDGEAVQWVGGLAHRDVEVIGPRKSPVDGSTSRVSTVTNQRWVSMSNKQVGSVTNGPIEPLVRLIAAG